MIRQWTGLAALLLLTGCGGHSAVTDKQAAPNLHTSFVRQSAPSPAYKMASSISTNGTGSPELRIQQTPDGASDWLSGLFGNMRNAPATPPAESGTNGPLASNPSQVAQQVLNLVNQERSKAGLQPLAMNGTLSSVAMVKAQDMYDNNYFDHQSPTHGSPFDMMKASGITYNSAGENIAKGQTSAAEVMNQWMNSPGHRANILNGSFTQIGIANYNDEWVQEFIG